MSSKTVGSMPSRLHHYGTVVRDQSKVRHFMEDVLGFPLVATWVERSRLREIDEEHTFCHTFFELEDGSALAFFQFADPNMFSRCRPKILPEVVRFDHIAIRVSLERYDDLKTRLTAAAATVREIDHGYCLSLYTRMEDGLELEFTVDPADVDAIRADQRAHAHEDLQRWLAGERSPNNSLRQRYSAVKHT